MPAKKRQSHRPLLNGLTGRYAHIQFSRTHNPTWLEITQPEGPDIVLLLGEDMRLQAMMIPGLAPDLNHDLYQGWRIRVYGAAERKNKPIKGKLLYYRK